MECNYQPLDYIIWSQTGSSLCQQMTYQRQVEDYLVSYVFIYASIDTWPSTILTEYILHLTSLPKMVTSDENIIYSQIHFGNKNWSVHLNISRSRSNPHSFYTTHIHCAILCLLTARPDWIYGLFVCGGDTALEGFDIKVRLWQPAWLPIINFLSHVACKLFWPLGLGENIAEICRQTHKTSRTIQLACHIYIDLSPIETEWKFSYMRHLTILIMIYQSFQITLS